jgi:hypothetical protein
MNQNHFFTRLKLSHWSNLGKLNQDLRKNSGETLIPMR